MKYFSVEEFDKMYQEIMRNEQPCFDTLVYISQKSLYRIICKWCYTDSALRGRQYEDDIMQLIHIRLIKNCVKGFFMKKADGNYDPDGFDTWMKTVATNIFIDFAKKIKSEPLIDTEDGGETKGGNPPPVVIIDASEYTIKRLNEAFKIVVESDSKVHIVLTWLAQMLIIASTDMNKIDANLVIEKVISPLTLDDMFLLILKTAKIVPWLQLEQSQIDRIKLRLNEKGNDNYRLGDYKYESFYMKKGPKASISDWVNRMNSQIEKKLKK